MSDTGVPTQWLIDAQTHNKRQGVNASSEMGWPPLISAGVSEISAVLAVQRRRHRTRHQEQTAVRNTAEMAGDLLCCMHVGSHVTCARLLFCTVPAKDVERGLFHVSLLLP